MGTYVLRRPQGSVCLIYVSELYHFRPVTACLAVNYLDRFLSSHSLPEQTGKGGGWPLQLPRGGVRLGGGQDGGDPRPLLLDLQVLEPRFVFEPRTIRRMELLLMAALRWRMRAITPFDFLDAASSVLPSAARRRCAELILETSRVVDFLGFPPSVVAGAAIVCAGREIGDSSSVDDADLLRFLGDSESVRGCRQLMEEYLIDTCPFLGGKPCSEPITPRSPSGVLDAAECGGCSSDKSSSSASQAEPPSKRRRIGHR
ncbi:hypothetical protein J5N97_010414 [Dioscorea zingiberensis]|uniref:Cyclin C-terminal domain-containing protein n=1 Tax=Dioscorea zingiberensis TaxID=325984 RepID=A0A9D5HMF8_9LILI|nr:hypothetical protein J5N97_010414 [Dioscorea zingiberensis]